MKKYTIFVVIILIITILSIAYFWRIIANADSGDNYQTTSNTRTIFALEADVDDTNKGSGSIIFGGDVMLARWVEKQAIKNGWDSVFSEVDDMLSESDCRVVNLESPIKSNEPQTSIDSLIFAAKPEAIKALTSGGIDAVSLANNHVADQAMDGLNETISILDDNDIEHFGAANSKSTTAIIQCGKVKIGLVGATYSTNLSATDINYTDLEDAVSAIESIKNNSDKVYVLAHWGSEYNFTPSPYQKELARKYIDAGADGVIGAHPHVLQPIEMYKNKVIAYSLGNFVFDQAASGEKTQGALLKINFESSGQSFEIIPIDIKNYYQPQVVGDNNSDSDDDSDSGENVAIYKERLSLESLTWN